MDTLETKLLTDIEAFLARTGMGASYFGKRAAGNSELVRRLREGRPLQTNTERRVRVFMAGHALNSGHGQNVPVIQGTENLSVQKDSAA